MFSKAAPAAISVSGKPDHLTVQIFYEHFSCDVRINTDISKLLIPERFALKSVLK